MDMAIIMSAKASGPIPAHPTHYQAGASVGVKASRCMAIPSRRKPEKIVRIEIWILASEFLVQHRGILYAQSDSVHWDTRD
jgi:hypothetical protein